MRADGRAPDELRPITFERDFTEMAAGSCLVSFGQTRVLCTASIDEDVPRWMRGRGTGWVTAEYSMLPGLVARAGAAGGQGRQAVGPQPGDPAADRPGAAVGVRHGARSASGRSSSTATCSRPTAAPAPRRSAAATWPCTTPWPGWWQQGAIANHPLTAFCAAISVGVVGGVPMLDLPYVEDSTADVDMNVVMTSEGRFVEVQGTAEGQAVHPGRARRACSAWPRRASPRSSTCSGQTVAEPPPLRPSSDRASE